MCSLTESYLFFLRFYVVCVCFCVLACRYENLYRRIAQEVRHRYPHIQVNGGNYPPSETKQFVANVLRVLQLALILLALAGDTLFATLGMREPEFYQGIKENKLAVMFGSFFVLNSLIGSLLSTGAFEAHLDGERVWSKLESGQAPVDTNMVRFMQILDEVYRRK
jgi:selT/selW/selH-like putative selenoprotein